MKMRRVVSVASVVLKIRVSSEKNIFLKKAGEINKMLN